MYVFFCTSGNVPSLLTWTVRGITESKVVSISSSVNQEVFLIAFFVFACLLTRSGYIYHINLCNKENKLHSIENKLHSIKTYIFFGHQAHLLDVDQRKEVECRSFKMEGSNDRWSG